MNNTKVTAETATLNASTAYALYISKDTVGDTSGWTTTHSFASDNATNEAMKPVSTTGKNQTTPMTFVTSNAWLINGDHNNVNEVTGATAVDAIAADNLSSSKVQQITGVTGASATALATLKGDDLYDFTKANEVCTVTAYVWMEGCDYDTIGTNLTSITGASNKLVMDLGFCAAQ
ncbi:MAG: hypothetical protein PHW34_03520 [Hespellia sp.]|nr:hypothetical protein [Hespellia sp.]